MSILLLYVLKRPFNKEDTWHVWKSYVQPRKSLDTKNIIYVESSSALCPKGFHATDRAKTIYPKSQIFGAKKRSKILYSILHTAFKSIQNSSFHFEKKSPFWSKCLRSSGKIGLLDGQKVQTLIRPLMFCMASDQSFVTYKHLQKTLFWLSA